jgi:hypothetical protein
MPPVAHGLGDTTDRGRGRSAVSPGTRPAATGRPGGWTRLTPGACSPGRRPEAVGAGTGEPGVPPAGPRPGTTGDALVVGRMVAMPAPWSADPCRQGCRRGPGRRFSSITTAHRGTELCCWGA